jgi:class 3 adenylate cyclase/tetratricopeptide (TPR) repeat protein
MTCPSCGTLVPAGSRFCPSCGHPLATPIDERRVVTVLFADLVGFTSFSEDRDPEQVKNIVDRGFERLAADVAAFGGTVDKVIGDAIVALFGAPVAHEDDAERAVRAAFQMQRTLIAYAADAGVDVEMRIGINTGEVLVGALRAGGEYTAMGDVVNIASRLQSEAAPGEIVVGQLTYQATSDVIRYEKLGPVEVKGREGVVRAWRAVGSLAPPGHRPRRGRAPLVGRDAELGLLQRALDASMERRRSLFVLLLGEAGMGKSRIAEELGRLANSERGARVLEGRCLPYGEANVWWPLAEVLHQACEIGPADSVEIKSAKCRSATMDALGPEASEAEVQRIVSGLLHLMGHVAASGGLDPARARDQAIAAVLTFLGGVARDRALLLILSELHWADALVLDLVDRVLDRLCDAPFVLVATARSELEERWRPKPGRHNSVLVTVDPLDQVSAGLLLSSLLGTEPSSHQRDLILERSGGNPFFIEELVALLSESRDAQDLPATLRGLVAARLDTLSPAERAMLEDAATMGRSGPFAALAALAERRGHDAGELIESLTAKDLLAVSSGVYSFRTDLVRDVAYSTLTKAERARRHAALATWLAAQGQGTGADGAALEGLAHHYGAAATLLRELGTIEGVPHDVLDRALHSLESAAAAAESQDQPTVSSRLYSHIIEIVEPDKGGLWQRAMLGRARARATLRDTGGAHADVTALIQDADAAGDPGLRARALIVLGDLQQKQGDAEASIATLDAATEVFRKMGDRQGLAEALRVQGMTHLFAGNTSGAEDALREALEAYRSVGDARGEAWALQNLAWLAFAGGDYPLAEERLFRSSQIFSQLGDVGGIGWATGLLAYVRFSEGHLKEAEEIGRQVLEVSSREDPWPYGMMTLLLGMVFLWSGRTAEAVELCGEAREVLVGLDDPWGELRAIAGLCRSLVGCGRVAEGLELVDIARERARSPADKTFVNVVVLQLVVALGDKGQLPSEIARAQAANEGVLFDVETRTHIGLGLLQLGRVDEAVNELEGFLEEVSGEAARARTFTAVALAYAACGRSHEARDAADGVERLSAGSYWDRAFALTAAGFAAAQEGAREEADAFFARALGIVDSTGDRLAQALIRLAHGRAIEALGAADGAATLEEARSRLDEMGLAASGWDIVWQLAAAAVLPGMGHDPEGPSRHGGVARR